MAKRSQKERGEDAVRLAVEDYHDGWLTISKAAR
jgi:hypothetical protein